MGTATETETSRFFFLLDSAITWPLRPLNVLSSAVLRSPQPKMSPVSISNDGIEPVSPAGAGSEPEGQGGAAAPMDQGDQG